MKIFQKNIELSPKSRGYHIVTEEISRQLPEMHSINTGLAHIHILHTSAGLTINENADPSVRRDFETFFNRLVPEDARIYEHTAEGPDDMTSHIKNSVLGCSVTVPVSNGRFNLGTWQGIYLCEFRNRPHSRRIVVTLFGDGDEK